MGNITRTWNPRIGSLPVTGFEKTGSFSISDLSHIKRSLLFRQHQEEFIFSILKMGLITRIEVFLWILQDISIQYQSWKQLSLR